MLGGDSMKSNVVSFVFVSKINFGKSPSEINTFLMKIIMWKT